ncbi:Transcription factor bHLH53 [Platanthera zijinensis]|uniref:Transcription factor bHLH53 n=1 Tax=Platanthera zijinensis TaxID=2320716 RepID=A0AAP0BPE8_9ASPA
MAALSVYSDWEKPAGFSTTSELIASSEVAEALIGFLEPLDCPLFPIDDIFNAASDNALVDPVDYFFADNLSDAANDSVFAAVPGNLSDAAHDSVFAAVPDNLSDAVPENDLLSSHPPPDHCSLHCCAKRHRCCYSDEPQQSLCFESNLFAAEFAPAELPEPHYFQPTPLAERPEPPPPPPQYFDQTPFSATAGLSAQSAAARERRKRISDRTHELSRLIPGGGKMTTAEMLQAAHKYVRYLQAQISILGLDTSDKEKSGEEDELLRVLISSAAIQEKLSKQGMCLVPKEIAEEFVADPLLKFNPFMKKIQRIINTGEESLLA